MTEAERWVDEQSRARGMEWTLLWAMAKRANGCVAQMTAEEAIKEGRISRSELYKALWRLSRLRELERISKVGDKSRVRAYHLRGMHLSPRFANFSPLCPLFSRGVSGLRDSKQEAEDCCLCRGTGWKVVPRPDRQGQMALRCERHVVQLPLLAIPLKNWEPLITPATLEWRSGQLKRRSAEFRLEAPR